jgi:hypothetical protein
MPPTSLPADEPSPRPPDCPIHEDRVGGSDRFRIPPGRDVVPLGGFLFVTGWLLFWVLAIAWYLFAPGEHGTGFTVLALGMSSFGLYFSSMIFFPAAVARFAVETLTLGPEGFSRETRFGPVALTRRVDLAAARAFRLDVFPSGMSGRGPRRWTSHLTLTRGAGAPFRFAEGARDEDKAWLADRLNERLRAHREGAC